MPAKTTRFAGPGAGSAGSRATSSDATPTRGHGSRS
jgi:hypothetical protein